MRDDAATFLASAEAYDAHIGRYGAPLAEALLDLAGVRAGRRALDVGCGPGALTGALARRLEPAAVAAVDPSEPFARACARRHPGVDVRVAPAERLPFADGAFDATLSQLVVNFMTDAPRAVREMARVTRPRGAVAASVWDYAGEMTLLRALWDAAAALDPAATEHDEGRRMRYCAPAALAELWASAGLDGVVTGAVTVRARYASMDDLWRGLGAGAGPSGAYVAGLPPAARERLRGELHDRLGAPDGPFALDARAWTVIGRPPSLNSAAR
jgi:SAM-dependent methyltransferase